MAIKRYKPYTPSRRHMTVSAFDEITKSTPEKSLVVHLRKTSGRNNQGKLTVRHHGGGAKTNTDWLTLNVTKTAYLQLLRRLNTIPTEQQTSL